MANRCVTVLFMILLFFSRAGAQEVYDWNEYETEHFTIIYRDTHAHLIPEIARSAEKALQSLIRIFNYVPSEKIVINTYDFSDFGAAGTTTVPHNYIRLEIEPFELGYETMPYNNRIQWILSHELVHVVMNDQACQLEKTTRSLFSKVPPEKKHPFTVFYSVLTNFSRYTPRWHQEGIAVFWETWLSGGFGRILSNFDEMYFRTMVLEHRSFPTVVRLDGKDTHISPFLEMLFYFYGTRFITYLAIEHGSQKVLKWFTSTHSLFYEDFTRKFRRIFNRSMEQEWQLFLAKERRFQRKNIDRLQQAPLTPVRRLVEHGLGWVTQAYFDPERESLVFGHHQAHHLASLKSLNLKTGTLRTIGTLPTPSLIQVSSTAYDPKNQWLFYTTNNNRLFRDVWMLELNSRKKRLLFQNFRVGQLAYCPATRELWGVQHSQGRAGLVFASHPFRQFYATVRFDVGIELQHLSLSPDGSQLAATLHQADGTQSIIVVDCQRLKSEGRFIYREISSEGTPEFPAWSKDGKTLYWNAYINGVSNIYRCRLETSQIEAISHTLSGLFRPVEIVPDTLFAFEFTPDGFRPVLIPNKPARRLPAIEYYGQRLIEKEPQLASYVLPVNKSTNNSTQQLPRKAYRGSKHIQIHSAVPILTGFQGQKVLGFFSHLADPLFVHDITMEFGYSLWDVNPVAPRIHFKTRYEYKRTFSLGINHNATDFYDLFNERKRGMIGTKTTFGYVHFWKYDMPHKVKQSTELAIYTGIEAINDNLVRVSKPDFFVFQSVLNSTNLRNSIGRSDTEQGSVWQITAMLFGVDPKDFQLVGGIHAEWDRYQLVLFPHHVLHFKVAAGIRHTHDRLAIGKFYFGGFGNRRLENVPVKQYRKVFRFPGIPIYNLAAKRFVKGMIEETFPPIRLAWPLLGHHYINHLDISWYSQFLYAETFGQDKEWIDLGAQVNMVLKHWYNLESTISAGIAKAWSRSGSNWEWFISYKVLR